MKKQTCLWDLDGTLTDPKLGITRCIQHALKEGGFAVPETDELLWCIGPPLHESFATLAPQADAWDLVRLYRERFATIGLFENEVYAEISEMLASLDHCIHYVATSKPHIYAEKIIAHFQLHPHFVKVYGAELDGTRTDKAELIAHILKTENLDPANTLMIGDRKHDIIGAKKNGLTALGLTWGYGGRAELEEAGADFIFDRPADLRAYLSR